MPHQLQSASLTTRTQQPAQCRDGSVNGIGQQSEYTITASPQPEHNSSQTTKWPPYYAISSNMQWLLYGLGILPRWWRSAEHHCATCSHHSKLVPIWYASVKQTRQRFAGFLTPRITGRLCQSMCHKVSLIREKWCVYLVLTVVHPLVEDWRSVICVCMCVCTRLCKRTRVQDYVRENMVVYYQIIK